MPREIVLFLTRRDDTTCVECKEELPRGGMITLRGEGDNREALCRDCADLAHLEFLPRGNAALTRRASKHSGLRAVVVQWSRTRKRYERQGILAEPAAIERAEEECLADADLRERRNERRREREAVLDAKYVAKFADAILAHYPGCPRDSAAALASHACRKHSGRIGRAASARALDSIAIKLAVRANLRHTHTKYDELLMEGWDRDEARAEIAAELDKAEALWRGT